MMTTVALPAPLATNLRSLIDTELSRKVKSSAFTFVVSGSLLIALILCRPEPSLVAPIAWGIILSAFTALGSLILAGYQLARERRTWTSILLAFRRYGNPEVLVRQVEAEMVEAVYLNGILVTPNWLIDLSNAAFGKILHTSDATDIVYSETILAVMDDHFKFFLPVELDDNGVPTLLGLIAPSVEPQQLSQEQWDLFAATHATASRDELIMSSKKQELWINVGCSVIAIALTLWIIGVFIWSSLH